MELCGGSRYKPSDVCPPPPPPPSTTTTSPITDDPIENNRSQTPIQNGTNNDYVDDKTKMNNHRGITQSPNILNPLTDEDWSTRWKASPPSSSRKSVAADCTRKLVVGIELIQKTFPGRSRGRQQTGKKNVIMQFDPIKSTLSIRDKEDDDQEESDPKTTISSRISIPLSSIDSVQDCGRQFSMKLASDIKGYQQFYFIIIPGHGWSNSSFVDGFKRFLDRNRPIQLQRRFPKDLRRGSKAPKFVDSALLPINLRQKIKAKHKDGGSSTHRHEQQNGSLSSRNQESTLDQKKVPQDGKSSTQEKDVTTVPSEVSADPGCASPSRNIRVFETQSSIAHLNFPAYSPTSKSPADQGMELALIGPRFVFSDAQKDLEMPVFEDESLDTSSYGSSSLSLTHINNGTTAAANNNIALPKIPDELIGDNNLPVSPLVHTKSVITAPWCEADLCTLSIQEISEAFADIFGVQKRMQPKKPSIVIKEDEVPARCLDSLCLPGNSSGIAGEKIVQPFLSEGCAGTHYHSPSNLESCMYNDNNIRNRKNMTAKARHRQRLRYRITFAAVKDMSAKKMHHIQTIKSFDEAEKPHSFPQKRTKSLINIFDRYLNSDRNILKEDTENVLYYDSDLEDARERTFEQGPRQVSAEKMNRTDEKCSRRSCGNKLRIPRKILHSPSVTNSEIKTIVSMMKAFKFTLLWHPNPTKEKPQQSPCCVHAWIERGTYLMNQNYVQPKFMWKSVFEDQLASKRKINLDIEKFGLLEIARIDGSPKNIDRNMFPFVHKPSCFVIKTKTNYFLFQAQSATEQAHIVFGLKLVVARLASLLIVRHMAAVEEFFEPNDSAVPGKAPSCITDRRTMEV